MNGEQTRGWIPAHLAAVEGLAHLGPRFLLSLHCVRRIGTQLALGEQFELVLPPDWDGFAGPAKQGALIDAERACQCRLVAVEVRYGL